jgi:DNA polymerase-3 subunit beta
MNQVKAKITLNGKAFCEAVKHALRCTYPDRDKFYRPRPQLSAVLFEHHEGRLRLVATDTYRLLVQDLACDWQGEGDSIIVPGAWLKGLLKQASSPKGMWSLSIGMVAAEEGEQRGLSVKGEHGPTKVLSSFAAETPQVSGEYPDWQKQVPRAFESQVALLPTETVTALKQVNVAARDDANRTELWRDGPDLYLRAQSDDVVAETSAPVAGHYSEGPTAHVGASVAYLLDYLKWQKGEVVMGLNGPVNPMYFQNGASFYVVMPMQLDPRRAVV